MLLCWKVQPVGPGLAFQGRKAHPLKIFVFPSAVSGLCVMNIRAWKASLETYHLCLLCVNTGRSDQRKKNVSDLNVCLLASRLCNYRDMPLASSKFLAYCRQMKHFCCMHYQITNISTLTEQHFTFSQLALNIINKLDSKLSFRALTHRHKWMDLAGHCWKSLGKETWKRKVGSFLNQMYHDYLIKFCRS